MLTVVTIMLGCAVSVEGGCGQWRGGCGSVGGVVVMRGLGVWLCVCERSGEGGGCARSSLVCVL